MSSPSSLPVGIPTCGAGKSLAANGVSDQGVPGSGEPNAGETGGTAPFGGVLLQFLDGTVGESGGKSNWHQFLADISARMTGIPNLSDLSVESPAIDVGDGEKEEAPDEDPPPAAMSLPIPSALLFDLHAVAAPPVLTGQPSTSNDITSAGDTTNDESSIEVNTAQTRPCTLVTTEGADETLSQPTWVPAARAEQQEYRSVVKAAQAASDVPSEEDGVEMPSKPVLRLDIRPLERDSLVLQADRGPDSIAQKIKIEDRAFGSLSTPGIPELLVTNNASGLVRPGSESTSQSGSAQISEGLQIWRNVSDASGQWDRPVTPESAVTVGRPASGPALASAGDGEKPESTGRNAGLSSGLSRAPTRHEDTLTRQERGFSQEHGFSQKQSGSKENTGTRHSDRGVQTLNTLRIDIPHEARSADPSTTAKSADRAAPATEYSSVVANPLERLLAHGRPVREVTLDLSAANQGDLQLRIVDRRGQVEVAVHSAQTGLREAVRESLPELMDSLKHAGYNSEALGEPANLAKELTTHSLSRAESTLGHGTDGSAGSQSGFQWESEQRDRRQNPRNQRNRNQKDNSERFDLAALAAQAA